MKIPGTPEGLPAIEQSIYAGIPINVTLLFSREQYLAAADAYLRGVERRIADGLDPAVDVGRVDLRQPLGRRGRRRGAGRAAQPARDRGRHSAPTPPTASCSTPSAGSACANAGARAQRLLFASTGTKDPDASDVLYVGALAAPFTIDTMPEPTLEAFAEHGEVGEPLPADGGDARARSLGGVRGRGGRRRRAGRAAARREGADAFDASWRDLLDCIATRGAEIGGAA